MAQKNGFLDNSLSNYAYICMCLRIKTYPIDIISCVLFCNADRLHRCVVLLHSKKKIALRLWHENILMIAQKNERGSWDAYKLVREYVGIAWMLNFSEQLENLPWDNQVRVQRVASAICAFLSIDAVAIKPYDAISMVFSNYENKEVLNESQVSESDSSKIKSILCQMSNERWRMQHLLKSFSVEKDREQLLGVLLRYRIAVEELENTFSGVLEARTGAYIGINALQDLYHPMLQACNDKVDELIVLLLGDSFKKSFEERELIEKCNYPTATDEELLEWRINNL